MLAVMMDSENDGNSVVATELTCPLWPSAPSPSHWACSVLRPTGSWMIESSLITKHPEYNKPAVANNHTLITLKTPATHSVTTRHVSITSIVSQYPAPRLAGVSWGTVSLGMWVCLPPLRVSCPPRGADPELCVPGRHLDGV